MGQSKDPFEERGVSDKETDEMIYDFADVHKWDDVIVKRDGATDQGFITWGSTFVASHRGVAGKSQQLKFYIDAKAYEESLRHPELNRGVILMAGDTRFPLQYCWLRPFSVHHGKALFVVSIPEERLGETYIAFIPRDGKKRYLYNLREVVLGLKKSPKAKEEKLSNKAAHAKPLPASNRKPGDNENP
jgi:hypothetical protein